MPETSIGFFTDVGASYFLPRIKGNACLGMYLGLTGSRLKAKDAVAWGVATHFVFQAKLANLLEDIMKNVTKDTSDQEIEAIVSAYAEKDVDQPI